jgi:hypothetical protein
MKRKPRNLDIGDRVRVYENFALNPKDDHKWPRPVRESEGTVVRKYQERDRQKLWTVYKVNYDIGRWDPGCPKFSHIVMEGSPFYKVTILENND